MGPLPNFSRPQVLDQGLPPHCTLHQTQLHGQHKEESIIQPGTESVTPRVSWGGTSPCPEPRPCHPRLSSPWHCRQDQDTIPSPSLFLISVGKGRDLSVATGRR